MLAATVTARSLKRNPAIRQLRLSVVAFSRGVATASVPRKSKVWASADEAVKDVKPNSTILCGGAYPETMLTSTKLTHVDRLRVVWNTG